MNIVSFHSKHRRKVIYLPMNDRRYWNRSAVTALHQYMSELGFGGKLRNLGERDTASS